MNANPICHPSPANKMKCFFLDYVHFWWSAWLIDELEPHLPPLSYQKMKCSYFDYVQLLMIGRASCGTQTPFATPLHPKKWNAHFWITFNFWWLARLVNGLEPHPPLLYSQKKWNAHFWITFPSDDLPGWLMNLNLICHPSPTKKWNAQFLIMFNFWWLAGLVNGLKPHPSPLSYQKMKCSYFDYVQLRMLARLVNGLEPHPPPLLQPIKWNAHFWIMFTSVDQPGWLMDSNPICHPYPDKKMKCSYFDYVQLLMIGQAGQWTRTPSNTPLQPKKMKCSFLDYVPFWWSAWLNDELEPHLPPLSYQKNEMLNFWLRSTSDDRLGW